MLEKVLSSPVGELRLVASDAALVGVYFPDHRPAPRHAGRRGSNAVLEQASAELDAWFGGERRAFAVALAPQGTPFQRAVWDALSGIPYGERWSYADLARAIGRPSATRAVAAANGRNPLSILVPCHRVVGSDGSLTGYAGGLDAKRWLLAHEARQGAAPKFSGSERSFPGRPYAEDVRSETGNAGGKPQTSRSAVEARHGAGAVLA